MNQGVTKADFLGRFADYTVVDVEMPNHLYNRICSLAILVVRKGQISQRMHYFINPECEFNDLQTSDIDRDKLEMYPTFPVVWQEVEKYFTDQIIVSYNAVLDLSTLNWTLRDYGLKMPSMSYFCPMMMAQKLGEKKAFRSYSLKNIACGLGIEDERSALVKAVRNCELCYQVFEGMQRLWPNDIKDCLEPYQLEWQDDVEFLRVINQIYGMLVSVFFEDEVDIHELCCLLNRAIAGHRLDRSMQYYDFFSSIKVIFRDRNLSQRDIERMVSMARIFTDSSLECSPGQAMEIFAGILYGLSMDDNLSEKSLVAFRNWMENNHQLSGYPVYDLAYQKVCEVLDVDLSPEERIIMAKEELNAYHRGLSKH
ncbi:MAG: exonuclease domain-containing protein [Candidatus Pararuminococcus gallinarum]